MLGSTPILVSVGSSYIDAGATAYDNMDGNITANITTISTVNTAVVGNYTVAYNVSDAAGNAATQVVRTVNVTAVQPIPAPVPTPSSGGGGCVMGVQQNEVDPLFPILIALALGVLYRRRRNM